MSKRENLVVSLDEIKQQQEYINKVAINVKTNFGDRTPRVHIETWGCQMN